MVENDGILSDITLHEKKNQKKTKNVYASYSTSKLDRKKLLLQLAKKTIISESIAAVWISVYIIIDETECGLLVNYNSVYGEQAVFVRQFTFVPPGNMRLYESIRISHSYLILSFYTHLPVVHWTVTICFHGIFVS